MLTDNNTQLMLAAYHCHAPLVKLLLEHGADPNKINDRDQSPLAGAVFKGKSEGQSSTRCLFLCDDELI